jgi:hypothetical protein
MRVPTNVPNLFKQSTHEWLEEARDEAENICRKKGVVTIEDVLKVCPRPNYVHRNSTGNMFHDDRFYAFGWIPSGRPAMNGRQVRIWKLREGK